MARNPFLITAAALSAVYAGMVMFFPIEWLRLLSGALMTGFALAAAVLWLPDAMRMMREGRVTTDRVTLVAVALVTAGTAYIGTYSIVFNTLGRPLWLSALPVYALGQLLLAFGNFLLTANPARPNPTFHNVGAWTIALGVLAGVAVGFFLGLSVAETSGGL